MANLNEDFLGPEAAAVLRTADRLRRAREAAEEALRVADPIAMRLALAELEAANQQSRDLQQEEKG